MIIDGQEMFDQGKIANCFNKFFVDIDPKLTSMVPESQIKFDSSDTFQKIVYFMKNNLIIRHLTTLNVLFYYLQINFTSRLMKASSR